VRGSKSQRKGGKRDRTRKRVQEIDSNMERERKIGTKDGWVGRGWREEGREAGVMSES